MKPMLVSLCVILAWGTVAAGAAEQQESAGFLFAYYPSKGRVAEFNRGYRQHLEWHRERKDPLIWYGWYVGSGERTGMFVDGTFGLTFAEFDRRIAPAEDAENFRRTVAPYGDTAYRKVLRMRPALSTAAPLEEGEPPANIEVLTCVLVPGMQREFEAIVGRVVKAVAGSEKLRFTVYQQLSGGEQPAYILMIPRQNFADFANADTVTSPAGLVEAGLSGELRRQSLDGLSRSVAKVYAESWTYREKLSYFPER